MKVYELMALLAEKSAGDEVRVNRLITAQDRINMNREKDEAEYEGVVIDVGDVDGVVYLYGGECL